MNGRFLRAASILAIDLALVAAAGCAVAIMLTGGGVFHVGGLRISSLGARNPLIVAFALLALRLTFAAREPSLLVASVRPDAMAPLAAKTTRALGEWLSALPPRRIRHVLLVLLGGSLLVKTLNIFYHYGFCYGDDVEIHRMTFSVLQHRDLGVCNLRSPFYPLVFIYPFQSFWCVIACEGVALGIAASVRFSEAIFFVPTCLTLVHERRFRSLGIAALTMALTCLWILGPGDRLYWPSMFFSLRNAVDFTLVKGLSTRGFEPVWHYLLLAPLATDVVFIGLLLYSFRFAGGRLLVWSVVPLVLLSAFRHKEERYLLPLLPFWALCVSAGFWRVVAYSARQGAGARCYLALYLFAGLTLFEMDGWRFRRSEDAVDVARDLSRRADVHDVAMEEGTTVSGASLYLTEKANVVDIESSRLGEPGYLRAFLDRPEAQYVVLSDRALRLYGYGELLRAAGYVEVSTAARNYGVFRAKASG